MRSMYLLMIVLGTVLGYLKQTWLISITMTTIMKYLGKKCVLVLKEAVGDGNLLTQPQV